MCSSSIVEDVPGTAGCATGQEVLPDREDQTSGVQDPPTEMSAALRLRETEGHCRGCQKRPRQGGLVRALQGSRRSLKSRNMLGFGEGQSEKWRLPT